MSFCLESIYPIIVPPHAPWPLFVVPSDQHSDNPITEPSVMASMILSAEHSVNPNYLPSYKYTVSNQPTNNMHCLYIKIDLKIKLHIII